MLPLGIQSIAIFLFATFIPPVLSQSYTNVDQYIGENFYDTFNWETFDDPTHGRVDYVNQETAKSSNLSFATDNKFIMRADPYSIVQPGGRGRRSVRITSHKCYTESVFILDLSHMPEGCGTWPAFWSTAAGDWPQGGEIDIIEGVNLNSNNLASLHTSPGCTMPDRRTQTGQVISTNCDSSVNNNQGCGVASTAPNTYGSGFNNNDGGWFVTSRSSNQISTWFWPRNAPNVPNEISQGDYQGPITPGANWGVPDSVFPYDSCDYNSHFKCHQIIINLALCGDWAGSAFPTAGCGPANCQDFVDHNPDAFRNAYWEINTLRVYTP